MGTRKHTSHAAASSGAGHKRPSPKLAKLTRPQASNAVPEIGCSRVWTRLKSGQLCGFMARRVRARPRCSRAISGPEKFAGIWYQVDGDDGDPASFFYYLGLAAAAKALRKRQPMPLLTPEYLLRYQRINHHFFRELCSRLGDTAVLVFDNYQEVAAPSVFHKITPGQHLAQPAAGPSVIGAEPYKAARPSKRTHWLIVSSHKLDGRICA